MRLHRFYIREQVTSSSGESRFFHSNPKGNQEGTLSPADGRDRVVINSPELVHQIRDVFRLKVGDKIIVFNGTGFDYECKIDSFEKGNRIRDNSVISLTVLGSKLNNFSPRRKLFLGAAIVRKDTFEWVVEKATELGVTDIIPIIAERSEKKALNGERLRKIAIEASEQSGRDTTPMVWQIMGLGGAVEFLKKGNESVGEGTQDEKNSNARTTSTEIKILAFHTEGGLLNKSKLSKEIESDNALAVFIGPEGGWSPTEIDMFHKENIPLICLGPQILRAETAAVVALSMVVFW